MSVLTLLVSLLLYNYVLSYNNIIKINDDIIHVNNHGNTNTNNNNNANTNTNTNSNSHPQIKATPTPTPAINLLTPTILSSSHLSKIKNKCFSYADHQYTYSLCPYQNITQSSNKVGHFNGVLGLYSNTINNKQFYINGTACASGFKRITTVNIICGVNYELKSITEPLSCQYNIILKCPEECIASNNVIEYIEKDRSKFIANIDKCLNEATKSNDCILFLNKLKEKVNEDIPKAEIISEVPAKILSTVGPTASSEASTAVPTAVTTSTTSPTVGTVSTKEPIVDAYSVEKTEAPHHHNAHKSLRTELAQDKLNEDHSELLNRKIEDTDSHVLNVAVE